MTIELQLALDVALILAAIGIGLYLADKLP